MSTGVYPRACGGTVNGFHFDASDPGLSPRVRGNQLHHPSVSGIYRSIPARAGEPRLRRLRRLRRLLPEVYPRACGGTSTAGVLNPHNSGLSPRVRGNHRRRDEPPAHEGSIPARAGEPPTGAPGPSTRRVYPRACGGTVGSGSAGALRQGLSPRVRGNPAGLPCDPTVTGSIPARAGEPVGWAKRITLERVYPRACGGTSGCFSRRPKWKGLSPRVRGNPPPKKVI